jgi:hypothetical protein
MRRSAAGPFDRPEPVELMAKILPLIPGEELLQRRRPAHGNVHAPQPSTLAPPRRHCDTAPVDRPRVSVVIPAYNAAATLARALRSALAQIPPPDEILVIDDASTDATAALAEEFGAKTIRLPARAGAAAARNAGIAAATGEAIAFLDADDQWLPEKLFRQLPLLADASFAACGARLFAEDGKDLGPLYDGEIPEEGTESWRGLLARNTIATSCVVAWRRDLDAAGGFDPALPVAEDQDLWIRLALRGRLRYLDATLVHMHHTKISVSGVGTALGARQQMQFTLPMVERHIAANRARLSAAEVRRIRGGRLLRIGRGACWTGAWAEGAHLVLSAALLGYRPLEGFRVVARLGLRPKPRWGREAPDPVTHRVARDRVRVSDPGNEVAVKVTWRWSAPAPPS